MLYDTSMWTGETDDDLRKCCDEDFSLSLWLLCRRCWILENCSLQSWALALWSESLSSVSACIFFHMDAPRALAKWASTVSGNTSGVEGSELALMAVHVWLPKALAKWSSTEPDDVFLKIIKRDEMTNISEIKIYCINFKL